MQLIVCRTGSRLVSCHSDLSLPCVRGSYTVPSTGEAVVYDDGKLHVYGVEVSACMLIANYFRKQRVAVGTNKNTRSTIYISPGHSFRACLSLSVSK